MGSFQILKCDIDLKYYYFKKNQHNVFKFMTNKYRNNPFSQTYETILSNSLDHFTCDVHNYYKLVIKFHRFFNSKLYLILKIRDIIYIMSYKIANLVHFSHNVI
jgi:hypothetical protein